MLAPIALVLSLMALWASPVSDLQTDVATAERMKQREEYLQEKMTWLLQDIERSSSVKEAMLHSVVLETLVYILVGGLVMFLLVWCVARKMNLGYDCCSEQDSASGEEDDEDDEEEDDEEDDEEEDEEADNDEEEELNGAPNGVKPLGVSTPSPTQGLPDTCKVLKELVGDLLGVCQALWKKNFLLQMHPVVGVDGPCEKWSVQENSIDYRLVVCLRPPPGHSFIVEQDTTGQLPARRSRARVVLECICSREQLLGKRLCFLHHPDDKLPGDQSSLFLRTLCTDSYLDMEKVSRHVQQLVRSAWLLLPESQHCQLTVLPSSWSCRFQLTGSSKMNIVTEIVFAVEQAAEVPT